MTLGAALKLLLLLLSAAAFALTMQVVLMKLSPMSGLLLLLVAVL